MAWREDSKFDKLGEVYSKFDKLGEVSLSRKWKIPSLSQGFQNVTIFITVVICKWTSMDKNSNIGNSQQHSSLCQAEAHFERSISSSETLVNSSE